MTEPRQATLAQIRSLDDVYDQLARQLDFPADFGRNLEALHDQLTGSLPGPVRIVWRGCLQSAPLLGPQFDELLGTLNDASGERADLEIVLG
ncbi:barstar family protein [Chitiniphilus purpureus]|uniref:Barstar family protein n=1 Tax=Chitiniphilus purpureus TaxID=2981137 RepID=A0ABY6DI48_9NEIS|nr:barstar family protein [Chitiniphilus sp. CD1]UXY14029.1 barstar family protein [Chitiniphilus sp. CD1]